MASGSQLLKVAVRHKVESVNSAVKVWRFDPELISSYKLEEVEEEILKLFPDISAKSNVGIRLSYKDSFVGVINLESDGDLRVRLIIAVLNSYSYM